MSIWDLFKTRSEPSQDMKRPIANRATRMVIPQNQNLFKRAYDAVKSGNLWSTRLMHGSADQELAHAIGHLRGRSRHLASNNSHMQRYLSILSDNVVGAKGFRLNCDIRNLPSKKNAEGSRDEIANGIIQNAFAEWSKKGNCTVDGKLSWTECQHMIVESLARDGEVFIHLVRGGDYVNGFNLQFIEPELIDATSN